MLVLNKCCWFVNLRIGCLIIGYLTLVAELGLTIAVICHAALLKAPLLPEDPRLQTCGPLDLIVLSTFVLLYIALVAFNAVLLVGLHQGDRGYIKAYLIFAVIFWIVVIILSGLSVKKFSTEFIIIHVFIIALSIYFLLVIRSYYCKLGSCEGSEGGSIWTRDDIEVHDPQHFSKPPRHSTPPPAYTLQM